MARFSTSRIARAVSISLSSCALVGTLVGCNPQGAMTTPENSTTNTKPGDSPVSLSGTVIDGPLVQATVSASDNLTAVSDSSARYDLAVPVGASFPLVIRATDGTDVVTGGPVDFTLQSAAMVRADQTVNLNPFTTLITKTAEAMDGGLNAANINTATHYIVERYGFGLDPAQVSDPISTEVTPEITASIVKASEALAETVRRTRDALTVVGDTRSADAIVNALAGDLIDGVIDGRGRGADPRIAATANVISSQVLIEVLKNDLHVQGGQATALVDAAIRMMEPSAADSTAQLMITDALLQQTLIALAAVQAYANSPAVSDISRSVQSLQPGTMAAQAVSLIPQDSRQTLASVTSIAGADATTLEAVNSQVRTSSQTQSPVPAPTDNGSAGDSTPAPSSPTDTGTTPTPTAPVTEDALKGSLYVAPNGSDSNPGTLAQPFHSLAKAAAAARPGDVILLRAGTYPLNQRFTVSGTSTAPITWAAYPGEKVIFDGSGGTEGVDNDHIQVSADWNIFRGFEVRNSPFKGIYVVGNHNRFEDLTIHHNRGTGLQVVGGNYNVALRVVAYWNHETLKHGDNSDGFSVSSGSHNKFYQCVAYKNSDDGFDLWKSSYSVIDRSVAHDNGYDTGGNGDGFKIGGGASAGASFGFHTVTNSVAYNNKANGFDWNANYTPNTLYNNTAWHNGTTANAYPHNFNFGGGTHILRNNLSLDGSVNMGPNVKDDHNSWNLGISNPKFISLDPSSPDFLRLAPDSPALNKGVDVGLPFNGPAPDLGAYESKS